MKLLFTANRFPYPPFRGDKLKIYHLARLLAQKHEIQLLTFLQDEKDLVHLPELEKIFTKIYLVPLPKFKSIANSLLSIFNGQPFQVGYFHSKKMEQEIAKLQQTEHFDAIHVQHLRMSTYWQKDKKTPRILDLPDAYSLYWKRRVEAFSGWKGLFAKVEHKKVLAFESILKDYDLTLVCSKEDAEYLSATHHLENVRILPNGVDTETFPNESHDYSLKNTILFTGNMDYAPNVDAVQYFADEIFPEIKKQIPNVHFIVAGQKPVKKVLKLQSKNIEVTGFVPDLSELYRKASLVVAPLRFGAGTQNKVLEAMSMGVPVVSGIVGFKGLNIQSGEGVILANQKTEFIQTCIRLLQNEELRKVTGIAGQEIIKSQFSWFSVAKQLEEYFKQVCSKKIIG